MRLRNAHPWISAFAILALAWTAASGAGTGRRPHGTVSREYFNARTLFEKLWEPGEPSPTGGDGLGPLFNERSCVGCHHLGGVGGAGGNDRNVTILTAFAGKADLGSAVFQGELEDLHPGFRTRTSIVQHKNAITRDDRDWLRIMNGYQTVQTRDDVIGLARSTRSTPALFGAGLLDSVPDSVLLSAEKRRFPDFPEIRGRASRLRDGRLGRFGWKGQTARLEDFVLAACANELGLEVPGHHQPSLIPARDFNARTLKLDLSVEECRLLVNFVAGLPAPVVEPPGGDWAFTTRGRQVFEGVGCATCHAPRLGSVSGPFSDLMLHDLGDRFRAFGGGYGGGGPSTVQDRSKAREGAEPTGEAGPNEWRTTPLWGVADSAPYLHDGRAPTLDEAILLHGGEAEKTSNRYSQLSFEDRQALLAFLHSLKAPDQPRRLADWVVRKSRGGRR